MYKAKAYSARSATSPLVSTTVARRDPNEHDIQIEILFCGICHSDLHQVRDEWKNVMPTVYPCVPGHEIVRFFRRRADSQPVQSGASRRHRLSLRPTIDATPGVREWRARRDAGFAGSARNLLAQLARIRRCRIVEHTGRAGRPRVRQQTEEIDSGLEHLGRALHALPPLI
jgi:hypothetical protein